MFTKEKKKSKGHNLLIFYMVSDQEKVIFFLHFESVLGNIE